MPEEQTDILYIGGCSRSGSTLLLRLLSVIDGYHSVGELSSVGTAFRKNPLCGCGSLFNRCDFWVPVIERAFGGFRYVDIERVVSLKRSTIERHHILPLVVPALRSDEYTARLREYIDFLSRLYGAVREISGAKVTIDSSKSGAYAFVLRETQNVNLNIVHLMRDSRARAYSWRRTKLLPVSLSRAEGPIRSSFPYLKTNLLLSLLTFRDVRYMTMRYEDLARNPGQELQRIRCLMRDRADKFDVLSQENSFELGVDHTVGGNPIRFQKGRLEVRLDDEWRTRISRRDKCAVTALTWPLLLAYGYWGVSPRVLELLPDGQRAP
jgi:hypothetical protein